MGRLAASAGSRPDGDPFESIFVTVYLTAGDHIVRCEAFDVADADRAAARFEALCALRD